ncbi:hypothetical protein PLESTM_001090000 [Pleodorina starrii]|nr:hypothetical protein PLESTM_001090000 [Pleodorina starrii]
MLPETYAPSRNASAQPDQCQNRATRVTFSATWWCRMSPDPPITHGSTAQVPNVEKFMSDFNMQCPMAATRLLHSGVPATVEHRTRQSNTSDPEALAVTETVEHFITAMDSLKLNVPAMDQTCPILLDLINSMDKVSSLPPDFPPRHKVLSWYTKLYQKPANYELPEEDVRQLMYELEASYSIFLATLRKK